jgi:hypothetical protein
MPPRMLTLPGPASAGPERSKGAPLSSEPSESVDGAELSGLDPSAHSRLGHLGHLKPVGKLLHGLIPVMWHSVAPLSRMFMVSRL